jgi:hypothetical protein
MKITFAFQSNFTFLLFYTFSFPKWNSIRPFYFNAQLFFPRELSLYCAVCGDRGRPFLKISRKSLTMQKAGLLYFRFTFILQQMSAICRVMRSFRKRQMKRENIWVCLSFAAADVENWNALKCITDCGTIMWYNFMKAL